MKASLIVAAALAASVNGAVIEARQRPRTTTTRVPAGGDVGRCGLDGFIGHEAEASLFCSSILKGGTATQTVSYTTGDTTTTKVTVITTLYPPSSSSRPPTSRPPTSTVRPPTSTSRPPTSTSRPSSTTARPSSTSPSPTPTPSGCGLVGYTKSTAAYLFDSSGTKNNFAACKAACNADSRCKSFGYGEANCMLFDVTATENTNYNPMSPYTFYDAACPVELPVLKARQIDISLSLPGGAPALSSVCSCLITSGVAGATRTTTVTITNVRVTRTETVTRTVSLLPEDLL